MPRLFVSWMDRVRWEINSARFSFLVIDIFWRRGDFLKNVVRRRAIMFDKAIYFRIKPLHVLGTIVELH